MLAIFFIYFLFLSDSCHQCQKSYSGTSLCSVATSKIPNFDFEIQESYNHVISSPICHSEHSRKITFINKAKKCTKDILTSQWRREQKQDTPARHPKNRQNKRYISKIKEDQKQTTSNGARWCPSKFLNISKIKQEHTDFSHIQYMQSHYLAKNNYFHQ